MAAEPDFMAPPSVDATLRYYAELLALHGNPPVKVHLDSGGGRGKGLFLTRAVRRGEVLWCERALAGSQDAESRAAVSACAGCHACTGTLERHVGEKLVAAVTRAEEDAREARRERDGAALRAAERWAARLERAVDPSELRVWLRELPSLRRVNGGGSDEDEVDEETAEEDPATAAADAQRCALPLAHLVPRRFLRAPAPVPCRLRCGAEFCTPSCEAAAWDRWHCLLCPGDRRARQRRAQAAVAGAGGGRRRGAAPAAPVVDHCAGVRVDRDAVARFLSHSDENNDIFRLAGQVVAMLLIETDRLLRLQEEDTKPPPPGEEVDQKPPHPPARAAASSAAAATRGWDAAKAASAAATVPPPQVKAEGGPAAAAVPPQPAFGNGAVNGNEAASVRAALARAALPFRASHHKPWWDAVGCPEDVEPGPEEMEFRAGLLSLATDSLQLLSQALAPERPELAQLLLTGPEAVEPFASLIGMFELNNLALNVPPPLDAYVAVLNGDALPAKEQDDDIDDEEDGSGARSSGRQQAPTEAERDAAAARVHPLLKAMGRDLAGEGVRGTAFYALQSCCNHACAPVARAEARPRGDVALVALRDLEPGEELTISYLPLDDEVEEGEDEEEEEDDDADGSASSGGGRGGDSDEQMGEASAGGGRPTTPKQPVVGMTLAERRAALRDYGFECACERCQADALAEALLAPSE